MGKDLRVYQCKKCFINLVNHSESQINLHLMSHNISPLRPKEKKVKSAQAQKKKVRQSKRALRKQIDRLEKRILEIQSKKPISIHKVSKGWEPHPFYSSDSWLDLRYRALKTQGRKCIFCGSLDGPFHVDHIKPRSKYPHLELIESNLQILCKSCNLGKGNKDEIDWRDKQ